MNPSDYFDDLWAHEGCVPWMYCDSRGFVTVGVGNLVSSPEHAAGMPFVHHDDGPATPEEKATGWTQVQAVYDARKSAQFYSVISDLRLTQDFIRKLVTTRLAGEFLPGIVKLCRAFETFPLPSRRALVDMAYNLGVAGLARFPHMLAACNAGDWAEAAHECHRSTCRDMRNAWTMQMFVDAAAVTPTPESLA